MIKNILQTLILTVLILVFSSSAAQISVAPLVSFTKLSQGKAQAVLTIGNNSNEPFRARLVAVPFTYSDNGLVSLPTGAESDLNPYLQFAPREFVIPAGQQQRVRIIALIPPSVSLGEHRAVLFAEKLTPNLPADDAVESTIGLKTRIGATLFVQSIDATPNISVLDARIDVEQLQMLLANSGDASARVVTKWQLKQVGSDDVILEGETGRTTIIAQTERYIPLISLTKDLEVAAGQYIISGTLTLYQSFDVLDSFKFETTLDIPKP